jgi:hypothetical protein
VVRGAWLGHVDDQALAAGPGQVEYLVGKRHRPDGWVPEDLLAVAAPAHLVPRPEPAEFRALDQKLPHQGGQVGGVRVGPRDGT